MIKQFSLVYVLTAVVCIGSKVYLAANTPEKQLSVIMHADFIAPEFQPNDWPSHSSRVQICVAHHFNHRFHWRRRWYSWHVFPYYFWYGSKIYLHTSKRNALSTWSITNDTPGILVVQTQDLVTEIPVGRTIKIPRHGLDRFQLYSHYTGERKQVRTYVPMLSVKYYPSQDYLIVMPMGTP